MRQIQAHSDGSVNSIGYCDADAFVTGGSDGSVRLFDMRAPEYFSLLFEHPSKILQTVVSGSSVAVICQGTSSVYVLDTRKPKFVLAELQHEKQVNCATWLRHN